MSDNSKVAMALIGGYVLGRTKKGKAAIRLAMWLSGRGGKQPQTIARESVGKLLQNAEVAQLAEQLRGPVVAEAQRVVTAALEARLNGLADSLQQRTKALQTVGGAAAGAATGAATGAAGQATETAGQATETAGQAAGQATETAGQATETAGQATGQATEAAGPATEAAQAAGTQATGTVTGVAGKLTGQGPGGDGQEDRPAGGQGAGEEQPSTQGTADQASTEQGSGDGGSGEAAPATAGGGGGTR
jgi:hypothetical protein